LVEVSSKGDSAAAAKVTKTASQPGTPLIKARSPPSSPQTQPSAAVPAAENAPLEEWNIDEQPGEAPDAAAGPSGAAGGAWLEKRWEEAGEVEEGMPQAPLDEFARYLMGHWTDNLGHLVVVNPTDNGGQRRDRRRKNKGKGKGKDEGQPGFLASMQQFGMPEKRFNVNKDRVKKEWTCGNGVLVREESSMEKMVWKAADGRVSTWNRNPPEGPVFFDAPPMQEERPWVYPNGGPYVGPGWGANPDQWATGPPLGEWKGLNLQSDDSAQQPAGSSAGEQVDSKPMQWNVGATEFVMPTAAPASSTPTLAPAAAPGTPNQQPAVPPQAGPVGAQAAACQLKLSEESPDVHIVGNRLEWVMPDDWGKLSRFPKDFCLTSPMFGVRQATNMQLVFYPNGSRTAEAGRCTVALTRGPASAGIKFEFSVNGRGSGPKVCLGRRYLGDYPKPHDDSEDNKTQKVTVCMQVLEVLGV